MIALRITVSATILGLLLWRVGGNQTLDRLRELHPGFLAAAVLGLVVVALWGGLRWQVVLRGYSVAAGLWEATGLYLATLFFALFVPGSVGGDMFRAVVVARREGRLPLVLLATLQERLSGLGAMLVPGLAATLLARDQLGGALTATLAGVQLAALAGVMFALYPRPALAVGQRVGRWMLTHPALMRLFQRFGGERVQMALGQLMQPLRLSRSDGGLLALALCGSAVSGVGVYWLSALALGLHPPILALCITVPVVTLTRVLPISLNGIGVGEGVFVAMLQPFAVPPADALAISLAGLLVHVIGGLIGGALLALATARGTWAFARQHDVATSEKAAP
jgi:hypothetical protein